MGILKMLSSQKESTNQGDGKRPGAIFFISGLAQFAISQHWNFASSKIVWETNKDTLGTAEKLLRPKIVQVTEK